MRPIPGELQLHCPLPRNLTRPTHSFGYYVWPTWVVWGFDRLIRLARALILNVFYKPAHAEGTLSLVTPDSLRLTLTRRVPFGWRPGQHVFLAFPSVATVPFEAHPFTIANVSASGEQELAFFIRAREGLTQRLVERVAGAEKEGVKVPVLVDGPYGLPPNLAPYTTAIFVAGERPDPAVGCCLLLMIGGSQAALGCRTPCR